MLMTIIAAVALVTLLFACMAIGVILANRPIKGSCGGLAQLGLDGNCTVCGGKRERCPERRPPSDERP
jgi:uncharacterized protein